MKVDSKVVKELFHIEQEVQENLLRCANDILQNQDLRYHDLELNESDRLLSIESIEKLCLKYRLRFLDIKYFKNEIPNEALNALESLSIRYNVKLDTLKVIAPGELFELENREKDPILVAELYNGKFLFIHKWGGEFNRFRLLQALPLKNIKNMVISVFIMAFLLTLILAALTSGRDAKFISYVFGTFHFLIGGIAFSTFIALTFNIFPTTMIWKSKYID